MNEVSVRITPAQYERVYRLYLDPSAHDDYGRWCRVENGHLLIDASHVEDIAWACEGVITANTGGDMDLAELNAARGLLKRILAVSNRDPVE